MNLEENFFQYFQEDEEHTTFPKLPVPTTSTPFDDFTLHLVEQHRETLEETTQNGFRPWKWKSPLSPIPKRKNAGDPLRNGGYKSKITKSNYHEKSYVRNQLQHILGNLGPKCPFFLKSMIHCNVVHGFSLVSVSPKEISCGSSLLLLKLWLLDNEILYVDSLFSSFGLIEKAQLLTGTSTDPPE